MQVRASRLYTRADFVNNLHREFADLGVIFEEVEKLDFMESSFDRVEILRCLRFFERVKTLSDVGVLGTKVLDGMFGHQFFRLVNHAKVQNEVLSTGLHSFPEIFALHRQLSEYRRRAAYEIPAAESDLRLNSPQRYEANLLAYQQKHFRA